MMLVRSQYITGDGKQLPSFALVPVSLDSPYVDMRFNPADQSLILVSKEARDTFILLNTLNKFGDEIYDKHPVPRAHYERRLVKENFTYSITSKDDIENIIRIFAINESSFPYRDYFPKEKEVTE